MTSPRFQTYLDWRCQLEDPPVELDLSHSGLTDQHLADLGPAIESALDAMQQLEDGAIANADENRMVGHYWLRAPGLAPGVAIQDAIVAAYESVEVFARRVHAGEIRSPGGDPFKRVVVCGIGGSALGPMLVGDVFAGSDCAMTVHVLDNTDPDGIDRTLASLGDLRDVMVLVISKSGGTPETRNATIEVQHACTVQGLDFAKHAVAITGEGSALANRAEDEGWLATFPMWDWVGGRTSMFSAVGLLPAALQGVDARALLAGAAAMDRQTRESSIRQNPAALLAAYWHVEGGGVGAKDMVVLPYKDRLLLLSRYLQQLVMESLGKREDRQGAVVHQGLAVYGNKGSTDQHAFVQQLRDGLANFFTVFVRVLKDRTGEAVFVEPGVTSGDYLDGFLLGTRGALHESSRTSATVTLQSLDERSFAALIALFERAVGLYAEMININAYHQPGVQAGKAAAGVVLALQPRIIASLTTDPATAVEIAASLGADPADVWPVLCHLAANRDDIHGRALNDPLSTTFRRV